MPIDEPRMTGSALLLPNRFGNLGAAVTVYLAAPEAGFIKEIHVIRDAAGGGGAFSTLTVTTPAGDISPTMPLALGGAAGDIDSQEFSRYDTNNVLGSGDGFSIACDGLDDGTPGAQILVVMEAF